MICAVACSTLLVHTLLVRATDAEFRPEPSQLPPLILVWPDPIHATRDLQLALAANPRHHLAKHPSKQESSASAPEPSSKDASSAVPTPKPPCK